MRLLLFQARRFWWKSFSKTLESVPDQDVERAVSDAVVVFIHAEAGDVDNGKLETKVAKNVKWLANKRGLKQVVLHSFGHLSQSNAPPDFAQAFISGLAKRLQGAQYQVEQTPFGYFCQWDLGVYGESLAKVFKEL